MMVFRQCLGYMEVHTTFLGVLLADKYNDISVLDILSISRYTINLGLVASVPSLVE